MHVRQVVNYEHAEVVTEMVGLRSVQDRDMWFRTVLKIIRVEMAVKPTNKEVRSLIKHHWSRSQIYR